MRVLFLTLYPDVAASPRLRVTQFVPYLRDHGVDCTVACPLTARELAVLTGPNRSRRPFWYHARETVRRVGQILDAGRHDVVFVQKAVMTAYIRGIGALLRSRARRLVYDIDDAVHLAPPHPLGFPWRLLEDRAQIERLFRAADLVLAGNAWLTQAAADAGARVECFPTVVDTDRFVPGEAPPDQFRIGWMGNPSTTICLEPAAEALASVKHAAVCLVGADPARVPWQGAIDHQPWVQDREVAELQRFSVGIMPQPEREWMRGKCALKALQYMACGIPTVASPFGVVLEFLRDGENGLLASSTADWLSAFDRLRDSGLRRRLGEAGRATVEAHYALNKAAPRLLELLQSIV
ncbi:MAG: glycosyltransferase [Nitrospiraceae bacterium]|nr:glycosyltransferase [Nitrospiraceae bacterium]